MLQFSPSSMLVSPPSPRKGNSQVLSLPVPLTLLRLPLIIALLLTFMLAQSACSNDTPEQLSNEGASAEQTSDAQQASGEQKSGDLISGNQGSHQQASTKTETTSPLLVGVMPSLDYLPLAIAEREGYFAELNLPVTIQLFFSANERDAAFQSNTIDGTVIDYTGAIIQHASGVNLRLTSRCDAPFYLLSSPASGVTALSALKGHSVAVSQNTVIDYLVDKALDSAQLQAQDVTKVEINRIPIRYEMLVNNKIDATGLPNPFALLAQKAKANILSSNDDLKLSITGIMFTQSAVEGKAEEIRKLYVAYAKGVEYLKTHSMEDIQDILIDRFGYTQELITSSTVPLYNAPALPDEESIRQVTAWLKDRELITPDYDPFTAGLLDGQYLP